MFNKGNRIDVALPFLARFFRVKHASKEAIFEKTLAWLNSYNCSFKHTSGTDAGEEFNKVEVWCEHPKSPTFVGVSRDEKEAFLTATHAFIMYQQTREKMK